MEALGSKETHLQNVAGLEVRGLQFTVWKVVEPVEFTSRVLVHVEFLEAGGGSKNKRETYESTQLSNSTGILNDVGEGWSGQEPVAKTLM